MLFPFIWTGVYAMQTSSLYTVRSLQVSLSSLVCTSFVFAQVRIPAVKLSVGSKGRDHQSWECIVKSCLINGMSRGDTCSHIKITALYVFVLRLFSLFSPKRCGGNLALLYCEEGGWVLKWGSFSYFSWRMWALGVWVWILDKMQFNRICSLTLFNLYFYWIPIPNFPI